MSEYTERRDTGSSDEKSSQLELSELELELVAFFVTTAQAFGLPKSIGEIYGLFFGSDRPLAMDDVIEKLKISKGSASQGIRFLRSINALTLVYQQGDRRDHFSPELSLRRIADGFLRERILPELKNGSDRLSQIKNKLDSDAPHIGDRIQSIEIWSRKAKLLVPFVSKYLGDKRVPKVI